MSLDRTFTIHSATTVKGCPTKKPKKSRYHSGSAKAAAKKAHTVLCSRKRVKGACTFVITMKETTRGSKKKLYTYKVTRHLLDQPVELSNGITYDYNVVAKKAKQKKKSKNCRKQSSGRMRKRSRKYGMGIADELDSLLKKQESKKSQSSGSSGGSSEIKRQDPKVTKAKVAEFMKNWKKGRKSPGRKPKRSKPKRSKPKRSKPKRSKPKRSKRAKPKRSKRAKPKRSKRAKPKRSKRAKPKRSKSKRSKKSQWDPKLGIWFRKSKLNK